MVRIMLIDDHPVVRAGLTAVLESDGQIDVVAQGSDGTAIDDLPADVDVVVTDIQMPTMTGIEVAQKLQAAGGPPVLILTTYDTQADVVGAMEAGALGYVLKDAPEENLRAAVLAAAKGERTLSPVSYTHLRAHETTE